MEQIVPPSFLFDCVLSIPQIAEIPLGRTKRLKLPETARVPIPSRLNSPAKHLELRMAWNASGIGVAISVSGRKSKPGGSGQDLRRCDHAFLMIDTRHTGTVHRAGSYCSAITVVPSDAENDGKASMAPRTIAQQRDVKQIPDTKKCFAHTQSSASRYTTEVWIPASQLYGFAEVPDIGYFGFYCVINDRELGEIPLSVGDDFPVTFDPSTWLKLELRK